MIIKKFLKKKRNKLKQKMSDIELGFIEYNYYSQAIN